MIPSPFDYARPTTLAEARQLIDASPRHALLAGGQSLMTRLKRRQIRPHLVIDLQGLSELRYVRCDAQLRVGAMARQSELAAAVDGTAWDLLAQAAAAASDPAVKNQGTFVGAICEADPAGDWLAAALAFDTTLSVLGPAGQRFVTAGDQALADGDLVTEAIVPRPPAGARSIYLKVKHPSVGWSIASVAVIAVPAAGTLSEIRIAVSGAVTRPMRLSALEQSLRGFPLADGELLDRMIDIHLEAVRFRGDAYASAGYRRKRLRQLLHQGLLAVGERNDEGAAPRS